jgi:hypothetical protein
MAKLGVSERLACRVLGQHRSTRRKVSKERADEAALTADIIALATQYGRYGYRRVAIGAPSVRATMATRCSMRRVGR